MKLCVHFVRLIIVVDMLEVRKVDTWSRGIHLATAGDGCGLWLCQM